MTKKPKKLSSKSYLPFLLSVLFLLIGLFIYALHHQMAFFVLLAAGLAISTIILSIFHASLNRKKSKINLQKEEYFEKANLLKADLDREHSVIEALRQKISGYTELRQLVEKLTDALTVQETAQVLTKELTRWFLLKDVTVLVYGIQEEAEKLRLIAARTHQRKPKMSSSQGDVFDQWVLRTLKPLIIEDVKTDFRFDFQKIEWKEKRTVNAVVSVPMIIDHHVLGILR